MHPRGLPMEVLVWQSHPQHLQLLLLYEFTYRIPRKEAVNIPIILLPWLHHQSIMCSACYCAVAKTLAAALKMLPVGRQQLFTHFLAKLGGYAGTERPNGSRTSGKLRYPIVFFTNAVNRSRCNRGFVFNLLSFSSRQFQRNQRGRCRCRHP